MAWQGIWSGMAAALRSERGMDVTYLRRKQSVSLVAIPARTPVRVDPQGQSRIESRMRDWLIVPGDLVIDEAEVLPIQGDTITDDSGFVWRVVDIDGEPCWRYTNSAKVQIRVHSQLIQGDG